MASQAFEVTPQQLMNTASELEELGATYQEKITKIEEARSQMDGQWVSDEQGVQPELSGVSVGYAEDP